MNIGVMVGSPTGGSLADTVGLVRQAAEAGVRSVWLPQLYGIEALTALAVAGREVPDVLLGTAVVPTWPRHPMVLAGQALTTQAAVGGRLVLGIGLSHQLAMEGAMGIPFEQPARHMREYLTALSALVQNGTVDFNGETIKATTIMGPLTVADASPFPILVAALAPRMVRLAGELADGTLTWMAGRGVIEGRIAPAIGEAAAAAGRPAPQVGVGLPVCVTADPAAARERAGRQYGIYGGLPSYRRLMDEEKVDGPADLAIVGDEDEVGAAIGGLFDAGATTFLAGAFGSRPEREATLALLGRLAAA